MVPHSLTIDSVPAAVERATPEIARRAFMSWSGALLFIAAISIVRFAYLVWLCPYQLVGDEAYYWCQSRHLDLCYDEKGPALPWIIAASCKAFGDHEWAVRLPMVEMARL